MPTILISFIKRVLSQKSKADDGLNRDDILYLTASGLLLALSAPGIGLWFLAWLGLIPLLFWLHRTPLLRHTFLGGFIFGLAFHALYLCWFTGLHPMTWLGFAPWQSVVVAYGTWGLISILGALLMGVLCIGFNVLARRNWELVGFPLLWIIAFSLYGPAIEIYVPWALLEYTQAPVPVMRDIAGTLGGAGITFLIVFHNVALTVLIKRQFKADSPDPYRAVAITTAIPLLLLLSTVLGGATLEKPFPFPVAVLQGNLPIEVIRSPDKEDEASERVYMAALGQAEFPQGTLVVLPEEGVVTGWVHQESPVFNPRVRQLMALSKKHQWTLATGLSSYVIEPYDKHTRFNSIALIHPEGTIDFYNKSTLVPFGEVTPRFHGLLPSDWLEQLLTTLDISYRNVFEPGPIPTKPIRVNDHPVSGLVCFELAYGHVAARQQGEVLINTSNLGWFHRHPMLEAQFLAIGQLRAAALGKPLIISANTGVSALIDAEGYVRQRSPSGESAELFLP